MKKIGYWLCLLLFSGAAFSQDPEFPAREFILHGKLQNGVLTNFHSTAPDIYTGGLYLVPQYTLIPNRLRAGISTGIFYTAKKIQASTGPVLSYKLTNFNLRNLGSGGNLHISLEHLWGTGRQRLFGGGLHAELLNFITTGLSLHRDYNHRSWWIQSSFGIRINKVKQPVHP